MTCECNPDTLSGVDEELAMVGLWRDALDMRRGATRLFKEDVDSA